MASDARYQTKVYLDTYLTAGNLTEDDDSTEVKFIVVYADPTYPVLRVFEDKYVSLIFSVGEPDSEALLDTDQVPWNYRESVPITICCIDKVGLTGTKLKWKGEAELRRITETYPTGSQRALERRGDRDVWLGSTRLYGTEFLLSYERDTT